MLEMPDIVGYQGQAMDFHSGSDEGIQGVDVQPCSLSVGHDDSPGFSYPTLDIEDPSLESHRQVFGQPGGQEVTTPSWSQQLNPSTNLG